MIAIKNIHNISSRNKTIIFLLVPEPLSVLLPTSINIATYIEITTINNIIKETFVFLKILTR